MKDLPQSQCPAGVVERPLKLEMGMAKVGNGNGTMEIEAAVVGGKERSGWLESRVRYSTLRVRSTVQVLTDFRFSSEGQSAL